MNRKTIAILILLSWTIIYTKLSIVSAQYTGGGVYYTENETTIFRYDRTRSERQLKKGTRVYITAVNSGWGMIRSSNGTRWTVNMADLVPLSVYQRTKKEEEKEKLLEREDKQEIAKRELEIKEREKLEEELAQYKEKERIRLLEDEKRKLITPKTTQEILIERAESQNLTAQLELARNYEIGKNGFSVNLVQSAHWYEEAANQGNSDAAYKIGLMYFKGEGVTQSNDKAIDWMEKSANLRHAEACYWMAQLYTSNEIVPRDINKIVYWLDRASELNHHASMIILAAFYFEGKLMPENKVQAAKILLKLEGYGYALADYYLGLCYLQGEGVGIDENIGLRLVTSAAESNHAPAQLFIGKHHEMKHDYASAVKWLRAAADQNDAIAQCSLAQLYLRGLGVNKSKDKARELFQKSANQGNEEAGEMLKLMDN